MGKLIPARYIGEHELTLSKYGGPYLDGDGKPRLDLHVRQGDTLMMLEEEVIGFTVLLDPRHINDPVNLGPGRVVLEAHRDKSAPDLGAIGYQFHEGRPDFEAVVQAVPLKKDSAKDGK
jgi:hypothetical protein